MVIEKNIYLKLGENKIFNLIKNLGELDIVKNKNRNI